MKSYYVAVMLLCAAQSMQGDGFFKTAFNKAKTCCTDNLAKVKVALNNPATTAIPLAVAICSVASGMAFDRLNDSLIKNGSPILVESELPIVRAVWLAPTVIGLLAAYYGGATLGVYGVGRGMAHLFHSMNTFDDDKSFSSRLEALKSAGKWTLSGALGLAGCALVRQFILSPHHLFR